MLMNLEDIMLSKRCQTQMFTYNLYEISRTDKSRQSTEWWLPGTWGKGTQEGEKYCLMAVWFSFRVIKMF